MIRVAMIISLMLRVFNFAVCEPAISGEISSSYRTAEEWPDYKNWYYTEEKDFLSYISYSNPYKPSYYVNSPILFGKRVLYLNDLKNPTMFVEEIDILGNGVVIRSLYKNGKVYVKLLINDKWVSGRSFVARGRYRPIRFYLVDDPKVISAGDQESVTGVLITLDPIEIEDPPFELRLKNKNLGH